MSRPRQIAVVGAGTPDPELEPLAEEVGRRIAEAGAVVVCGGLGGVMAAVGRGAAEAGGTVIGILAGEEADDANPHCTHVITTGIGHARNLAVAASASTVIAIGGEWGTLAEIAFARTLDRPVVALRSWSVSGEGEMAEGPGIEVADSPSEAVERALALSAGAR